MIFLPNTNSYIDVENQIERTLSAINKISYVKFEINTDEDISKNLEYLKDEVDRSIRDAEKDVEETKKSLANLIKSDFQISLESYNNTVNVFCDNNLHEIFADNYQSFPFGEWNYLDNFKYNFNDIRKFFIDLPQSIKPDFEIYFNNLNDAFNSVPDNKASFFKDILGLISKIDEENRDAFINKNLKDHPVLKNTMLVMMLTNKLDSKEYEYSKWQSVMEQSLIEQCSKEESKKQLINFLLHNDVNNFIFCERDNSNRYYNPVKDIKMENFQKIIDLDLKLELDLGNSLASSLVEIASKQYAVDATDIIDKCQGVASYMMAAKLERNLETKTSSPKQMKI